SRENIIPDDAELMLSIRTFEKAVRDQVVAAVERIVRAEAAASGAPAEPEISVLDSFPAVVNDPGACARTQEFLEAGLAPGLVFDPGLVTGSEDVGILASAPGPRGSFGCQGGPARRSSPPPPGSRTSRGSCAPCRPTTPRCSRRSSSRLWAPASPPWRPRPAAGCPQADLAFQSLDVSVSGPFCQERSP